MSKFTPGPWKFSGVAIRGQNDEPDIARVYMPVGMSEQEFDSNARLIAAAPEMYEALDALLLWIDGKQKHPNADAQIEARALLARIDGAA